MRWQVGNAKPVHAVMPRVAVVLLPCARITSIRFKGTFSADGHMAGSTPSEEREV
jgi:hypothetical protein